MKTYLLSIALLFIISADLHSQKLEGKSVRLQAITSVAMQEYFIETNCFENGIKIKFKFKDSILMNKLRTDSTYRILSKSLIETKYYRKNDTIMNLYKRVDSAIKVNTVYSIDSIKINYNENPEYEKLLAILLNSSQAELENKGNNKNRFVLDGTTMDFEFFQNDSIKFTAYAHSPNKTSHPLLYEYINSTMNIYRGLKKNNFLTKKITSGY